MFAAHRKEEFLQKLTSNNVKVIFIPAGCTGELQPLDVGLNDQLKKRLKTKFSDWYAGEVEKQLANNIPSQEVKVALSGVQMKPMNARWFISVVSGLSKDTELIKKAWEKCGIYDAIKDSLGRVTETPSNIFDNFLQ